jgi:alkylation response protein AidB-like acyl-CoA dehydrogenase
MTAYAAPIEDMMFALTELAGLEDVAKLPNCGSAEPDLVRQILEEAGKLGSGVLAPINRIGDLEGCVLEGEDVRTPKGFKEAWEQFCEGGWTGIAFEEEFGGQGLPWMVGTAVQEIWHAANMAFALCPMLTQGTVELLTAHGSHEQKSFYLPRLISGQWTGTMNLTEPQAGSDLGAIRTKAVRDGDSYLITGQKIFITYGEHDWAENIIHFTLARLPDAPTGVKGISLFIVPKFIPNEDGSLGKRNDLRCVSLEHKLGINASPTAVMSFGDHGGAVGYLVGEENRGLEYMFTMMNNARLGVGLEGVAIAERAYQQALAFSKERVQSRALSSPDPKPVAIISHPDVRRMLLTQKALTEASRGLAYYTAAQIDIARNHPDAGVKKAAKSRIDLMIPIVKAWSSECGMQSADLGVQVHGGMGFIEETGAAQHLRDVRITAIYEGTNGIQANDLVGRKLMRDGGAAMNHYIGEMREIEAKLASPELTSLRQPLTEALNALKTASDWIVAANDPVVAQAGALPFMRLFGITAGGWAMSRMALSAEAKLKAGEGDAKFLKAKITSARFFAEQILPQADGLRRMATTGADTIMDATLEAV